MRCSPLPFYIPFFSEKGTPFVYLVLTNATPFTYLNFVCLLSGGKALSQNQNVFSTFSSHKISLLALLTEMTDFPSLSYTSTGEIPTFYLVPRFSLLTFGARLHGPMKTSSIWSKRRDELQIGDQIILSGDFQAARTNLN